MTTVETSHLMNFIVSYTANRPVISPPGELMYRLMSLSGSSLSRCRSWAMIRFATLSSMGVPRNTIRSLSSRE